MIEFVEPLERAYAGMKRRLFNPADLGKWFTLGFAAWVAQLGENGGGGGINLPGNNSGLENADLDAAKSWVMDNLTLIIGLATGGFVLVAGLSILFLWLRSRGAFMFLDNAIRDRTRISEPWHEFQREGNSLFLWSLGFGVVVWIVLLALLAGLGIMVWSDVMAHRFGPASGMAIVLGGVVLIPLVIALGAINRLLLDFVVPLMWRHRVRTTEAWRIFRRLVSGHAGSVFIYLLLHFAVSTVTGILVLLAGLCTCCCGFILLALPVVNATVMLPITLTMRLFPLEFLRQFGPDGDCLFVSPPDIPIPPAPPAMPELPVEPPPAAV